MIKIVETLTDEQILNFALEYCSMKGDQYDRNVAADIIITNYIINEFAVKDIPFSEKDIHERFGELLSDYILASLAAKGMLDPVITEDGVSYTVTEHGQAVVDHIKGNK